MLRNPPVGFKEEEVGQDEKAGADRGEPFIRGLEPSPGMRQGLCWTPNHRHPRALGVAGETDVITDNVHGSRVEGKCCGDAG